MNYLFTFIALGKIFKTYWVHVYGHVLAMVYVWRSKGNFWEPVFSFYLVSSRKAWVYSPLPSELLLSSIAVSKMGSLVIFFRPSLDILDINLWYMGIADMKLVYPKVHLSPFYAVPSRVRNFKALKII